MRDISIISIIRKYGLNSKKISPKYRVKYADTLKLLQDFNTRSLSVVNAIDNELEPDESLSRKCQVSSCGKHIRYEYWLKDKSSKKVIAVGRNCACALLALDSLQQKSFKNIEQVLKEKAELEEWKKDNKDVYDKLMKLKELNLDHFRPFVEEVEFTALNPEDTDYIRNINYRLILTNVKYMDVLKELIEYNKDNKFYKSVYDRIAYQAMYISGKQKDAIDEAYEEMRRKKTIAVFNIHNAYDFKDKLKEMNYKYNSKTKCWYKEMPIEMADDERDSLLALGIKKEDIK